MLLYHHLDVISSSCCYRGYGCYIIIVLLYQHLVAITSSGCYNNILLL